VSLLLAELLVLAVGVGRAPAHSCIVKSYADFIGALVWATGVSVNRPKFES
jgi:hypothetical protein